MGEGGEGFEVSCEIKKEESVGPLVTVKGERSLVKMAMVGTVLLKGEKKKLPKSRGERKKREKAFLFHLHVEKL